MPKGKQMSYREWLIKYDTPDVYEVENGKTRKR